MSDVVSGKVKIQQEAVNYRSAASSGTMSVIGGSINYLIDFYNTISTQFGIAFSRSNGTSVGIGGVAISSSSGAASTTSTSYVAGCTCTLITQGGPVKVGLMAADTTNESYIGVDSTSGGNLSITADYAIYRDGTQISTHYVSPSGFTTPLASTATYVPPGTVLTIDTGASAASHTYTLQYKAGTNAKAQLKYVKLYAYEF